MMAVVDTRQTLDFADRLSQELSVIPQGERDRIIFDIGKRDIAMRQDGQDRPLWRGPLPEFEVLGREVVARTDMGERVGRVVFFGVCRVGSDYERSVVVHVPASGTWFEAPSSAFRVADGEALDRMRREEEMASRLREAAVQAGPMSTDVPERRPRVRRPRDPRLLADMLALVRSSSDLTLVDPRAYHQVYRTQGSGRRVYIAKNGSNVNVAGFEVEHPDVVPISAEQARAAGLGSVRGQLNLEDPTAALAALRHILEML